MRLNIPPATLVALKDKLTSTGFLEARLTFDGKPFMECQLTAKQAGRLCIIVENFLDDPDEDWHQWR